VHFRVRKRIEAVGRIADTPDLRTIQGAAMLQAGKDQENNNAHQT